MSNQQPDQAASGRLAMNAEWRWHGGLSSRNTCAYLYRQSPEGGPYANAHSATPLSLVRKDGRLIDVYQHGPNAARIERNQNAGADRIMAAFFAAQSFRGDS